MFFVMKKYRGWAPWGWGDHPGFRVGVVGLLLGAATLTTGPQAIGAQAPGKTSLEITPTAVLPVGTSADAFEFGYGAGLHGRRLLGDSPVFLGLGMGFGIVPTVADTAVTLIDGGVGAGLLLQPGDGEAVDIEVGLRGGGYASLYEGAAATNPHGVGYSAIRFRLGGGMHLGVAGNYGYYSNFTPDGSLADPFFTGAGASISLRWTPGPGGTDTIRPQLEIAPPRFDRVFPVFYRFYDENPLGAVSFVNEERNDIENVSVSFFVPRYMEAAQVVETFDRVGSGQEIQVDLTALFNEEILGITETDSVQAQIIVQYTHRDVDLTTQRVETLAIQNRNQMTWDDDRKAAAFVTAGDPTVQRVSRNVTSITRGIGNVAVNERLRTAIALHETMGLYGLEYVIDPDSSYIELSENESALDYLQFPVQTLDYRAGDCDDLSILYCSMFEAVGIPTAFITVPGHIFMAIDLGIREDDARNTFAKPEDLIFREGTTWLPIETTVPGQSFVRAWDTAAKQYREAAGADAVGFFPVREAWNTYPPTGFASTALERPLPPESRIADRYEDSLVAFVQREIAPQVDALEARIAQRASPRLINRLGTLYARYGLYDEAIETFRRAVQERPYAPSLYNIGNIHFLNEQFDEALGYYRQTVDLRPDDPEARLGLARTYYELAEYVPATEQYREVEILAPELAAQFGYIVSESRDGTRASAAAERDRVIWGDD